jgi:hypothetical protein
MDSMTEENYLGGRADMSQKISQTELWEKTHQLRQGHGGRIVAPLTRRTFFKASPAVGAGLGLLAAASGAREARAQSSGASAISSNFNGTAIPGGDWIWFTSVLKVHGLGSAPVTIGFMGSIEFSVDQTQYIVPVPSALVTFSPFVTLAKTVFSGGQWVTTVPLSGLAGNVFLDGFAVQVPKPAGFPGGIKPVTWQGTFFSMTPGISVQWQWSAAVYNNPLFGADYNQLGVKPVDDNKASIYQNSDHAGTPEYFEAFVVGGATGGGGSNFTGSYSGTAACVPLPVNMMGGGS